MYRVYCQGIEFGIDYETLDKARQAKAAYAVNFPKLRYYIRKAHKPRLSILRWEPEL